jgi:hypothetical protein
VHYEWRAPIAFTRLSEISRWLFFSETRVAGTWTPYYRHYMWNKLLTFSALDDIAAYVADHSAPDETLTGASMVAPLIALRAGRRLAADESDTNAKRFKTGLLTPGDFFRRACGDKLKFVVSMDQSYFNPRFMSTDPFAQDAFVLETTFHDATALHSRPLEIRLYAVRRSGCGYSHEP